MRRTKMDPQQQQIVISRERKSMALAYVLLIVLGQLGVHRFYLERSGSGFAQLILGIVGWLTIWVAIGILPLAILWIWLIADLFLIPGMAREGNQRVGVATSVAATTQMPMRSSSEIRKGAYEELPREEEERQRAEEAQRRQEAEARAEAETSSGLQRLASVPETVDLSPYEALDEAQGLLTRQGYEVVGRTDHSLTVQRGDQQFFLPDSASTFTSTLKVLVHPQLEGGVRMEILGDNSDPVPGRQQAEWREWAENLPKRMEDANTTAEEETTVSPREVDTDGERDLSDLLERFEAAEDRLGVRLEGIFARMDQENGRIRLNGELHAREGGELGRDIEVVATVHDASGRVVDKRSTDFRSGSFFAFEAFSLSMEAGEEMPAKIRVYPKAL
jgi:TM2 domain-containing membrane protein YozV